MLVGYMRISSDHDRQSTDLQRDALLATVIDASEPWQSQAGHLWCRGVNDQIKCD
jgi:hypothetical protein